MHFDCMVSGVNSEVPGSLNKLFEQNIQELCTTDEKPDVPLDSTKYWHYRMVALGEAFGGSLMPNSAKSWHYWDASSKDINKWWIILKRWPILFW